MEKSVRRCGRLTGSRSDSRRAGRARESGFNPGQSRAAFVEPARTPAATGSGEGLGDHPGRLTLDVHRSQYVVTSRRTRRAASVGTAQSGAINSGNAVSVTQATDTVRRSSPVTLAEGESGLLEPIFGPPDRSGHRWRRRSGPSSATVRRRRAGRWSTTRSGPLAEYFVDQRLLVQLPGASRCAATAPRTRPNRGQL